MGRAPAAILASPPGALRGDRGALRRARRKFFGHRSGGRGPAIFRGRAPAFIFGSARLRAEWGARKMPRNFAEPPRPDGAGFRRARAPRPHVQGCVESGGRPEIFGAQPRALSPGVRGGFRQIVSRDQRGLDGPPGGAPGTRVRPRLRGRGMAPGLSCRVLGWGDARRKRPRFGGNRARAGALPRRVYGGRCAAGEPRDNAGTGALAFAVPRG